MQLVKMAEVLAETVLAAELPRRWTHVRAVAEKSDRVARAICDPTDLPILVAAAWLHDVGYAREIAKTALHALDGARWLRHQGVDLRIASLVAYHSCAIFEAEERGLADELLAEFSDEETALRDALWYADMTTGPDGQHMDARERLAEVRERYGPDHLVTRFWARAEPTLMEAIRRTEERLKAANIQPM